MLFTLLLVTLQFSFASSTCKSFNLFFHFPLIPSPTLKGGGGYIFSYTGCPHSRRDPLNAESYRPQRVQTLGTKSRFGAHTRGETYYCSAVSSTGCLNTKATWPLSLHSWCPRLRRGLPWGSAVSSSGCLKTPRRSVFLVPTPRERRVENIVVSSLKCINTKMTRYFGDYA